MVVGFDDITRSEPASLLPRRLVPLAFLLRVRVPAQTAVCRRAQTAVCREGVLTILWDIGLEVGHSVRTLKETITASKSDITIATSLQEARLLIGDDTEYQAMLIATGPKKLWPSNKFFEAKFEEQEARHQRYRGTTYNLEPNVKEGIGGLRDMQVIAWVLKRHFDADLLVELVGLNFLTQQEFDDLGHSIL